MGLRRIVKAVSDHVLQVEDRRRGGVDDIHACLWRTPVVVWATFVRWGYSLRLGVAIKGYSTIL